MRAAKAVGALFALLNLAGCGAVVPALQEIPGTPGDTELLVQGIVRSVHCELRNAIWYVIDQDKSLAALNQGFRNAPWLDNWGVQVGLTLTVDEKTSLDPTVLWTPPSPASAIFSLAGGINLSSEAKRIDKLNYYYTVKQLYALGPCLAGDTRNVPFGSLLIQSDLKLREWLLSQVLTVGTGTTTVPISGDTPLQRNALSHQVSFEVISGGSITPVWKLVHVAVNPSGTLLSTSRNRNHDLLLVFGPADPRTKNLVGAASDIFLASQIGTANRSNIRIAQ
jgi:hypothetical protein